MTAHDRTALTVTLVDVLSFIIEYQHDDNDADMAILDAIPLSKRG